MIKIIVAMGKNSEIGLNGKIPWHLREDLIYFKDTTSFHTVVMGANTYRSLGKPLPNRKNIVITHGDIDDVFVTDDPKEILEMEEDVFIIGGSSIYEYFLPYASELYITKIDASFEADTFFPTFDRTSYIDRCVKRGTDGNLNYEFHVYSRIKDFKEVEKKEKELIKCPLERRGE